MVVTIELNSVEFRAYHGCYDLEKRVGNNFRVDLSVVAEIGDAAERDDVNSSVNYLLLYELVERQMKVVSNIVENVGLRIVEAIFEDFDQVLEAKVRVCKIAPPLGGKVQEVCVVVSKSR